MTDAKAAPTVNAWCFADASDVDAAFATSDLCAIAIGQMLRSYDSHRLHRCDHGIL
jgi:hypothetical protein